MIFYPTVRPIKTLATQILENIAIKTHKQCQLLPYALWRTAPHQKRNETDRAASRRTADVRLTDRAARLTRRAVRQTYRDGSERNATQRMKNALVWGGP